MREPIFLLAFAMMAGTVIIVAKAIAGAIAGRGPSRSELTQIRERLEQQTAALEDAQASIALQTAQLAEMQERIDFAERLLAQARDRSPLGPGGKPA